MSLQSTLRLAHYSNMHDTKPTNDSSVFCLVPSKEWKIEIGSFQFKKGVISREEANR